MLVIKFTLKPKFIDAVSVIYYRVPFVYTGSLWELLNLDINGLIRIKGPKFETNADLEHCFKEFRSKQEKIYNLVSK